ncbi:MAG: prepilin-type N-terminal cleavage/methylation domain-containing protein [Candidatus Margulisbacteria bacterium]|nr:prepilin-type N-terminal cleavage/methylation domain-containing protein [Candidatus Margulisiibacteriota bacterium]
MRKKGFTLVELVVALTIFGLLLGGIYFAFGVELKFWQSIANAGAKQQISNLVLSRMISDIRSAKELIFSANGDELILMIGADRIEYSITNNKVLRKKNNFSVYLTDQGELQTLSVAYPTTRMVEIMLGNLTARASLRN